MKFFSKLMHSLNSAVMGWSMREWMAVAVVLVVIGVICLRGNSQRAV